jgi:hypothetical protein
MALGSTQPLTEISHRVPPGDKGGRCVGLTTWEPERPAALRACVGIALSIFMSPTKWRKLSHLATEQTQRMCLIDFIISKT